MQNLHTFKTVEQAINNAIIDHLKSRYEINDDDLNRIKRYTLVEIPSEKEYGDIAITVAMRLAKHLKEPPSKIAESIVKAVEGCGITFESVDIAEPGFVNLRLGWNILLDTLYEAINNREYSCWDILKKNDGAPLSIQVEFVSANPTGPLNIVNARASALGLALSNLLGKMGAEVEKEYFVNDRGRQIDLLAESILTAKKIEDGEDVRYPDEGYKGRYIEELASEMNKDLYRMGDIKGIGVWASEKIRKEQERVLRDFGVEFDRWYHQSYITDEEYNNVLNTLRDRNALYEADKAVWIKTSEYGDVQDWVLITSDGRYTYHLADLAYHINKYRRRYDRVINILGPDHHAHMAMMLAGVKALGIPEGWLEIIIAQQVNIVEKGKRLKMGKRLGRYITMEELMKEVSPDVCKFFFLDRAPSAHIDFDFEVAKKTSLENPVFYIQYAYARIESLRREATRAGILIPDNLQVNMGLYGEEEKEIAREVFYYPQVVKMSAMGRKTQLLTCYLHNLAGKFHRYYTRNRILGVDRDLSYARQLLSFSVASVIRDGLNVLGISAPERM
ncbi:MAG: arginine--tRNA ligase [Candidatus Coatesbacteria bacterium 4484_99]|uniref:Arginine--tRNA ligase n=1 Tax=Candidatus Coatesbacteria bacterium 4484_99 TaxID=1970774 RepID=A0A1W9S2Y7_9BACT|nr:MAG: arginine--tRNA ligase [Candidatus Coatesbacteria bacterium 4484_99]